jgi:phosphoglycolate phosphatase-like HAD superfamily hydrolase
MPPKELLITDLDDTCTLDSKRVYDSSYNASMREIGVKLPDDVIVKRIDEVWGSQYPLIIRNILRDQAVEADRQQYADAFFIRVLCEEYGKHVSVAPETVRLLTDLKENRGIKLGITTAAPKALLTSGVMSEIGFPLELFDQIECVDDLRVASWAKPHPYTLNKIMADLQVEPPNAVMIGDAPNDFRAARAAKVDFIGVETGILNPGSAPRLGVQYLVANLAKITEVFDKLDNAQLDGYGFPSFISPPPTTYHMHD